MSERRSKSAELLRAQLSGMLERGVVEETPAADQAAPEPIGESDLTTTEEERMVPTRYGLRPASTTVSLCAHVTEGELYDFRQLLKRDGVTQRAAVNTFVQACLAAGRIITEEDLEWLISHRR